MSIFLRIKLCFLGAVELGATKCSTIRRDAINGVVLVIACVIVIPSGGLLGLSRRPPLV